MRNIKNMPKVELHLHIEGTLDTETVLKKAKEQNIKFDSEHLEKLSKPLVFTSLADFLVDYYKNMSMLENKQDFGCITLLPEVISSGFLFANYWKGETNT